MIQGWPVQLRLGNQVSRTRTKSNSRYSLMKLAMALVTNGTTEPGEVAAASAGATFLIALPPLLVLLLTSPTSHSRQLGVGSGTSHFVLARTDACFREHGERPRAAAHARLRSAAMPGLQLQIDSVGSEDKASQNVALSSSALHGPCKVFLLETPACVGCRKADRYLAAEALAFELSKRSDVAVLGARTGAAGFAALCDCASVTLVDSGDALDRLRTSITRNSDGELNLHRCSQGLRELADCTSACELSELHQDSFDLVLVPEPAESGIELADARRISRSGGTILCASESGLEEKLMTKPHSREDGDTRHEQSKAGGGNTGRGGEDGKNLRLSFYQRGDIRMAQA